MEPHENDGKSAYGGRDLKGYGGSPPNPMWPKNAKVALNFVINYEEGGEKCILHGDNESEKLLSEIVGASAYEGERHINMESLYDYGARAGFWRLYNLFEKKKIPATIFAVGMALERNPAVAYELHKSNHEVASHGYRWIDYQNVDEETQRAHINRTVEIHKKLLGKRPAGIYQGKPNKDTRRLVIEEGGFKYDSDSYADDLPYWSMEYDRPHLIIPYSLSENDMKFVSPNNYSHGSDFFTHLKQTLLYLIDEGKQGSPKMMSVGLHCRLARPGPTAGLSEFIDFCLSHKRDVWICTREQIADHWFNHHPPRVAAPPGVPGSPINPKDDERDSWTGPKTAEAPSNKEEEDEVDEADGDII